MYIQILFPQETGNHQFKSLKFKQAISLYTQGLHCCNANSSPELAAILYHNRSTCLFRLGILQAALQDANEAIKLSPGYDKALHRRGEIYLSLGEHLKARKDFSEVKVLSKIAQQYMNRPITASAPSNGAPHSSTKGCQVSEMKQIKAETAINSLCSDVRISHDRTKGRHIVASSPLRFGQEILSEQPAVAVLRRNFRFHFRSLQETEVGPTTGNDKREARKRDVHSSRCSWCFSRLHVSSDKACVAYCVPCTACSNVCYCSVKCRSLDWKSSHRFECSLIFLHKVPYTHCICNTKDRLSFICFISRT